MKFFQNKIFNRVELLDVYEILRRVKKGIIILDESKRSWYDEFGDKHNTLLKLSYGLPKQIVIGLEAVNSVITIIVNEELHWLLKYYNNEIPWKGFFFKDLEDGGIVENITFPINVIPPSGHKEFSEIWSQVE